MEGGSQRSSRARPFRSGAMTGMTSMMMRSQSCDGDDDDGGTAWNYPVGRVLSKLQCLAVALAKAVAVAQVAVIGRAWAESPSMSSSFPVGSLI